MTHVCGTGNTRRGTVLLLCLPRAAQRRGRQRRPPGPAESGSDEQAARGAAEPMLSPRGRRDRGEWAWTCQPEKRPVSACRVSMPAFFKKLYMCKYYF